MNFKEQKIKDTAKEIVEKNNFFLIDLNFRGNPKQRVIEIFIDGEKNISAEDCAMVSREINKKIEEENLLESSYRLDVSSPGVDRPLIYLKQFPKHVNRNMEIIFEQEDQTKKIKAKLLNVEDENLVFQHNNNEIIINFNKIQKAKVLVSFS